MTQSSVKATVVRKQWDRMGEGHKRGAEGMQAVGCTYMPQALGSEDTCTA